MSIHKKDIEDLVEAFTAAAKRGNNSAINLIPNLVKSLVHYVEEATGYVPTPTPGPKEEPKIAVLPVTPAAPALSTEDKDFAAAVAEKNLTENGNATIETDAGNFTVTADESTAPAEIAKEAIAEAEAEGATEITAVTTQEAEEAPEAAETGKKKPTTKK
jgi:hypothetical protein